MTVVTGLGTVVDGPASAHFDFGTRAEADDSTLVHVFILQNTSASPMLLERLATSCGCTTAAAEEAGPLPVTIAPGQSISIRIQITPRRLLPGKVQKYVWAYFHAVGNTAGPTDINALLEICGTVQMSTPPITAALPLPVRQSVSRHGTEPTTGQPAPLLTGTDTQGRTITWTAQRGHPTALLFLCGCPWCTAAARSWGRVQQSKKLPAGTQTVVIFDGDRAAARTFAVANFLKLSRTILLPDPGGLQAEGRYQVRQCPRLFALDLAGSIRYTNTHPDDQPRQASARTLTRRLQSALNSVR